MEKKKNRNYFRGDLWFQRNVHARVMTQLKLAEPKGRRERQTLMRTNAYQEEFRRQSKLFRQERQEKRLQNRESRAAAEEAHRMCVLRDADWGREHETDSDEMLLEYVRQCASALGKSPQMREVLGGTYISARFGSWALVLTLTGLYVPKRVGAVSPQALKAYQKRMKRENIAG